MTGTVLHFLFAACDAVKNVEKSVESWFRENLLLLQHDDDGWRAASAARDGEDVSRERSLQHRSPTTEFSDEDHVEVYACPKYLESLGASGAHLPC